MTTIARLPTDVAAFVGAAGNEKPRLVTSAEEFTGAGVVADAVQGFFANGGKRLYLAGTIAALAPLDEISIVAAPGETDLDRQKALITKGRLAILEPVSDDLKALKQQRTALDSPDAAIYFPAGFSGHVAGVYARTPVDKSPGSEKVHDLPQISLQNHRAYTDEHINVMRNGRLWSLRTTSTDPEWKYVNVRRLITFIERSIERGLEWVVFEPNDEPLWIRVRSTVSDFLRDLWKDGALRGIKPDGGYFVRCDRTTMTQDDIDNGRLIILVGVAPLKPAEFVMIRIGRMTMTNDD